LQKKIETSLQKKIETSLQKMHGIRMLISERHMCDVHITFFTALVSLHDSRKNNADM